MSVELLYEAQSFTLTFAALQAHRAVLVGRCDVMRAMLLGDFREAHSNVVGTGTIPLN